MATTQSKNSSKSSSSSKKKVAAAVGVAAAAAAGVVAARKLRNGKDFTKFSVMPHEDGWQVRQSGNSRASSVHETKKEALEAARELAYKHVPSRLEVQRADGSVQDTHEYGPEN